MTVPKHSAEKPASISERKHKITLTRCRKLAERQLEWIRPEFEQYVRAYRELYGCDPDTLEVPNTYPEDMVDDV
jgi:hypothetical protein